MKCFFSVFAFMAFSLLSTAQGMITNLNFYRSEDMLDLAKRKVVVVRYSEGLNENKGLEARKAKAKPKDIPLLEERIASNIEIDKLIEESLLPAVKEYWTIGNMSEVRYVTVAEVKELMKNKKAKDYAVIMIRSFTKQMSIYDGTGISKIELTAACFQGMESYGQNTNILGFPLIVSQEKWGFAKADITTTIKILNTYANDVKKSDKKITLSDFIETQVEQNCSLTKELTLHIEESLLKDATSQDVKANWGADVDMNNDPNNFEGYTSDSSDAFAVFIPTQIAEGVVGPISQQAFIYTRMVVQPSTGYIIGFAKTKMGERAGELFYKKGHLEDIGACGK